VRACIAELRTTAGVESLLEVAVRHIRKLTGYDRVLAYQYNMEDGTGYIVAEARREDMRSFLHLHFPGGDIPAPARRILGLVWVRYQPDTGYTPVPIVAQDPQAPPLDLSYSALRSTSAMCNLYYHNLGVRSKLLVALTTEGDAWGSCIAQNETPREIAYETRMACETIAHAVSSLLGEKERAAAAQSSLALRQEAEWLTGQIADDPIWAASLAGGMLHCPPSTGAMVMVEGGVSLRGVTPNQAQLAALVQWLDGRDSLRPGHVFATHSLSSLFAPAAEYCQVASGLLGCRLGDGEYLLWFRQETEYEITWAGDPQKPVKVNESDGSLVLSPRTDFQMHPAMLHGLSTPWKPEELATAASISRACGTVCRAESLIRYATELKARNRALESYDYVVSHDLREPLRGIRSYSQALLTELGDRIGEKEQGRLETIQRLSNRMDDLLQTLLGYARLGRIMLKRDLVDLNAVVAETIEILGPRLLAGDAEVRVIGTLPAIDCDRAQVQQCFVNLIMNGLKYNDSRTKVVEIGCEQREQPVFYVRDNGIGVPLAFQHEIFTVFRRLHGPDEYGGGTGVGLTIVQSAVERHGGRVWIESSPGQGAAFFFTLQSPLTRQISAA
jgi:light-regulated signal transduction histidine kinase (bacteriophytochrome)